MGMTADEYEEMPHSALAQLCANQAAELSRAVEQKRSIRQALHLRRLEVAELRRELGMTVDTECAAAEREELRRQRP